jgi:hypothetical protein
MLYTVIRRNVPQLFALRRSLPRLWRALLCAEAAGTATRRKEFAAFTRGACAPISSASLNVLGLARFRLSTSCRSASSVAATLSTERRPFTLLSLLIERHGLMKRPHHARVCSCCHSFSLQIFFPGTFRGGILSQEYGNASGLAKSEDLRRQAAC